MSLLSEIFFLFYEVVFVIWFIIVIGFLFWGYEVSVYIVFELKWGVWIFVMKIDESIKRFNILGCDLKGYMYYGVLFDIMVLLLF